MTFLVRTAAAAAVACAGLAGSAVPSHAYPVDCAILLCLAGGWPASAPCAQARAVFIQRITPWPIEPPLQIWNCPMSAALRSREAPSVNDTVHEVSGRFASPGIWPSGPSPFQPVQSAGEADVDISGAAFDFVRSIRVYHIRYSQSRLHSGECRRQDDTALGRYGTQGEFDWTESLVAAIPASSGFETQTGCRNYRYRSVFVDWRNQAGNYGFEEVRY